MHGLSQHTAHRPNMSKSAMDSARTKVLQLEKEITTIKTQIQTVKGVEEATSELTLTLLKESNITIQCSSPVEEAKLSKEGSDAVISEVDLDVATLSFTYFDEETGQSLMSSEMLDVSDFFDSFVDTTSASEKEIVVQFYADSSSKLDTKSESEFFDSTSKNDESSELDETTFEDAVEVDTADAQEEEKGHDYVEQSGEPSDQMKEQVKEEPEKREESGDIEAEAEVSEVESNEKHVEDEGKAEESTEYVVKEEEPEAVAADKDDDQNDKRKKSNDKQNVSKLVAEVPIKLKYKPSKKDVLDSLYSKLNEIGNKKAGAIQELREAAAAVSKSAATASAMQKPQKNSSNPAVKSGFLNKNKATVKKSSMFQNMYQRFNIASSIFMSAKNYIIFGVSVAFIHFRGQLLALPPPV